MKTEDLRANPKNPRTITDARLIQLKKAMDKFGDLGGIIFNKKSGQLVGGHQRTKILDNSIIEIIQKYRKPTKTGTVAEGYIETNKGERFSYREVQWDEQTEIAANIAANKNAGEFDMGGLKELMLELKPMHLELTMFSQEELDFLMPNSTSVKEHSREMEKKLLSDTFLVPPFSILDTRQGYWQERKRGWLSLGIESEMGRKENLLGMSKTMLDPDKSKRKKQIISGYAGGNAFSGSGTSIFDPVLCELAYRWFSPVDGTVLDPFSGGSVRGIVANKLQRIYFGCDLRQEQVDANIAQAKKICLDKIKPTWACGDSVDIDKTFKNIKADMIFSCPPYADLEVYSDDKKDLSTMEYDKFVEAYRKIIKNSVSLLKDNRFACFVVGEVRDKKQDGFYKNFVQDTISAFNDAGCKFYNEMILISPVGTVALRAAKSFLASRKVGKCHQNVLVFCKGDPKLATEACGKIDMEFMKEITPDA